MNTLYNKDISPSRLLNRGYKIIGKYNKKVYIVEKLLGIGENGYVYLVRYSGQLYALKMSKTFNSIDYEIYVINKLNGPQENNLEVSILDMDEFIYNDTVYSFYVMPYHLGFSLDEYLNGKTSREYLKIFKKTVEYLLIIHNKGWVFGDIKPEHIIVDVKKKSVYFIDFGGVTKVNEGVRQFTEIFDRGSWKVNNRKANSHYDLFSLSMVFIQIALGKDEFIKLYNKKVKISKVCDIIRNIEVLTYLFPIIKKVLLNRLKSSYEVLDLINNMTEQHRMKSKSSIWIYCLFICSLILFILSILFCISQY